MAHATVKLPSPLRPFVENAAELAMDGVTVGGIVRALAERYPPLRRHLFTPGGELRNFVTIYLNDQDVRYLQREATELKEGDIVSIVPALAGGAPR
jgi:sulfur-carrier protein